MSEQHLTTPIPLIEQLESRLATEWVTGAELRKITRREALACPVDHLGAIETNAKQFDRWHF